MNTVILLTVAACLAGVQAAPSLPPLPVNPGGIGGLFRGPNSETIIQGPDGSQITSEQIGGAIETEIKLDPIIVPDQVVPVVSSAPVGIQETIAVASPSPILSGNLGIQQEIAVASPAPIAVSAIPAGGVIQGNPVAVPVAHGVSIGEDPHIIETELVDAPEIEPDQSSDLKGPSGTISVRGSSSIVSGPASTTISEPVRKIPIAAVPIQTLAVQPATVLVPPSPIAAAPIATPSIPAAQIATASIAAAPIALPPVSSVPVAVTPQTSVVSLQGTSDAGTPLISLGGTSGAGIADAALNLNLAPPQIPLSSTLSPVSWGQSQIISSTPSPIAVSSSSDIDVSRIDLGQRVISGISPTVVSAGVQNVLAPTGQRISVSTQSPIILQRNNAIGSGGLLTPAGNIQGTIGRLAVPDQGLINNQIVSTTSGYTAIDNRDVISPSQAPLSIDSRVLNLQSVSSTILPPVDVRNQGQNLGPVASVLDTVLVQPTDPRNREVIEFGGRQLENVGNIVPVVRNSVLVTGDLRNIQQIPTASVSQLASSNELGLSRYGRDTKKI